MQVEKADIVVWNNGTLNELQTQAKGVVGKLRASLGLSQLANGTVLAIVLFGCLFAILKLF